MSLQKRIQLRTKRRTFRVRNKFQSRGLKPRVSVFRSLNNIYAQVIDDSEHKTIVSFSSMSIENDKQDKKEKAKLVGERLGKLAVEKGVTDVFFDRGRYSYSGRVRALADGLRNSGLKF